jgi:hypothetical protein
MELKQFRNKYDLELIPASHQGIIIGNLVWDPLIGKPSFVHPGMPNHIFNAFLDADLLSIDEYKQQLEVCASIEMADAKFAESMIDIDRNLHTTLEHPQIGKIGNNFNLESVRKFTFGELKVRSAPNLLRVEIDGYLELLKKNNWDDYDGRIRKVYMITELYYGSIKLVIDTDMKDDFSAAINNTDLKLTNELAFANSIQYTFDHQNVPFAMRLEKVKQYNG